MEHIHSIVSLTMNFIIALRQKRIVHANFIIYWQGRTVGIQQGIVRDKKNIQNITKFDSWKCMSCGALASASEASILKSCHS